MTDLSLKASKRNFDLMSVACTVFLLSIALAILWGRCLYADGAFCFLNVMECGKFAPLIKSRIYASYIFECPMVAAINMGITNPTLLLLAFGVGCFLPWPLAMWL